MIWILIPCYNEEKSLLKLLPKLNTTLNGKADYRIVAVNDGSYDETATILEQFSHSLPLDIITHKLNRGLGETERDGFEYIAERSGRDDIIVRVEGDDTHDPAFIFSMIEKIAEGYDVVNTSRFQKGGGQKGVNAHRALISRAANLFMRLVFRIPGVKDYSCGFRAYRAAVIQDAIAIFGNTFIQLRGLGFTSTLEILVKLNLLGCRFTEVPFILRYDLKEGSSKMIGSITTLGYLIMAVLYHFPFGGWKSGYKGLRELYRQNPQAAVEQYCLNHYKRHRFRRVNI